MKLYNTLSGRKETLEKTAPGQRMRDKISAKYLTLFVCGPTVYDYLHIGNGRTYVFFDAFVKYLRSRKIKVYYLQNITDIDDKIIARATEEGVSPEQIAAKYYRVYIQNMRALHVTAVDTYAEATAYIPEIATQVHTLLAKGYAYEIPHDGIYFDISKFFDYGRLARRTMQGAEDGVSRIDESVEKRTKGDFCLWKFGEIPGSSWNAPFGRGRPGWHIEDTAISEHYFGPQYDIHGAGVDLKFPHHEAEIAQQESISGKKPFVKIWMHVGSLTVDGKKMSKSLGNYISIHEFLKTHRAEAFRLMVLSHHYRSPLDYTSKLARDFEKSWNSILEFSGKLALLRKHRSTPARLQNAEPSAFIHAFHKALKDDFNTPKAIAALFAFVTNIEPKLWNLGTRSAEKVHGTIHSALKNLGFTLQSPKIPSKIQALAKTRQKYRKNKQFMLSDDLRKKIQELGYVVEDTPVGPFVWPHGTSTS